MSDRSDDDFFTSQDPQVELFQPKTKQVIPAPSEVSLCHSAKWFTQQSSANLSAVHLQQWELSAAHQEDSAQ